MVPFKEPLNRNEHEAEKKKSSFGWLRWVVLLLLLVLLFLWWRSCKLSQSVATAYEEPVLSSASFLSSSSNKTVFNF